VGLASHNTASDWLAYRPTLVVIALAERLVSDLTKRIESEYKLPLLSSLEMGSLLPNSLPSYSRIKSLQNTIMGQNLLVTGAAGYM
jgi:hypothetical protein